MPIIIVWILLTLIGILSIYSVSIYESFTLTMSLIANGVSTGDPYNYFYFIRQLRSIGIAVIVAGLVYKISMKFFQNERNMTILAIVLMALQVAVFIPGIGSTFGWARWWLDIPFLPSIQPSELFKLWYVLFLGSRLLRRRNTVNTKNFFISFIVINFILYFIFLLIPDLGTVMILGIVGLIMCRYMWAKLKYVLRMLFGWIFVWLAVWGMAGMISERFSYIQKRFVYFLNPSVDPQARQIWWQNQQALLAIGWWWLFGKWYGKWLQKFGYIPEAQSDFVFSALAEEIGFLWWLALICIYFYLGYYFLSNLHKVKDDYKRAIWVGIISLILVQVFVNIWVNIKILPNTWLTLPFLSYGWTALMVNLIEIVILYKIIKNK